MESFKAASPGTQRLPTRYPFYYLLVMLRAGNWAFDTSPLGTLNPKYSIQPLVLKVSYLSYHANCVQSIPKSPQSLNCVNTAQNSSRQGTRMDRYRVSVAGITKGWGSRAHSTAWYSLVLHSCIRCPLRQMWAPGTDLPFIFVSCHPHRLFVGGLHMLLAALPGRFSSMLTLVTSQGPHSSFDSLSQLRVLPWQRLLIETLIP